MQTLFALCLSLSHVIFPSLFHTSLALALSQALNTFGTSAIYNVNNVAHNMSNSFANAKNLFTLIFKEQFVLLSSR